MSRKVVRIPVKNIHIDPATRPKPDKRFTELLVEACKGRLDVYEALVPVGLCRVFDAEHRPEQNPAVAAAANELVEKARTEGIPSMVVYQAGNEFVVSDDCPILFAARRVGAKYVPCMVLGKPDHEQILDVYGPIKQSLVRAAIGMT